MQRHAVVLGSNGPDGQGALRFAKSDASRVADALAGPRCGFATTLIEDAAVPQQIEQELWRVAETCGPDDTFVIYFSGHGFVEQGSLLLMLDRTDIRNPLSSVLHADSIVRALRFSRARHRLLILDCCHAGAIFSDSRFKDQVRPKVQEVLGSSVADDSSMVTIVASDRLEQTREIDRLRGSFLADVLCDALGDGFEHADANRDGAIDLADLRNWFVERTSSHNRARPAARVPTPFIFGRERGPFFLSTPPEEWKVWDLEWGDYSFVLLPARSYEGAWMIGKTPVTNRSYREFVNATGRDPPQGETWVGTVEQGAWQGPFEPWTDPDFSDPDQPVVCVSLEDARQFASWFNRQKYETPREPHLDVGLPPNSLWTLAGFDSLRGLGDSRAWLRTACHHRSNKPLSVADAHDRTNRFGAVDMIGNVWEWTRPDYRVPRFAILTRSFDDDWDEELPDWVQRNVDIFGGGFLDDLEEVRPALLSGALHDSVRTRHSDLGFRLAATIEFEDLPDELGKKVKLAPLIEPGENNRTPRTA